MRITSFFATVAALFQASMAFSQPETLPSVETIRLKSHVAFLSHDLLEGRGAGTRGYDLAALYVATEFQRLGLAPVASTGSYYQAVPFRKANLVPERCALRIVSKKQTSALNYGEHFIAGRDFARTESSVRGDVVVAGFGVTAPDLKYDDYANIDVRDKIVLILTGAPSSFPNSERAHYSSIRLKEENAAARGAVGILLLKTPVDEERAPWERTLRSAKSSGYRWLKPDETPSQTHLQIQATATISRNGAETIFQEAGKSLSDVFDAAAEGKPNSFLLPLTAELEVATSHERAESPNVVGWLEGSDPALKNEFIVYTAHLDHLGITDPVEGDSINNGAYDNAIGIAALLEIARAFSELPQRPARSVMFVAVTAEEKGLEGSDYFASFPPVPVQAIAANINIDMILLLYPLADAVVLGAEHSSLGIVARDALSRVGLEMTPDPAPEEVRFVRSDQYSFVLKGIPAVRIISGIHSADPNLAGADLTKNWLRTIYHTPRDESGQFFHWESGIKIVQANILIGLGAANTFERPRWNRGDFFEKAR